MPKHFPSTQDAEQAPLVDFTVDFVRDSTDDDDQPVKVVETHEFTARPQMAYGDVLGMVANEGDGKALEFLDRLIRRCILNTDGVPEKWRPRIVEDHFTAPNGDHTHVDDLPKFEHFDTGSSRRRWAQLLAAADVVVEFAQITAIMEYLTEQASERPTSPRSRSAR